MSESNAAADGGASGAGGNKDPAETDPMMGEKKDDPSSGDDESSFQSSSSFDSSATAISYDEEKFIWDKRELDEINKRRKNADAIPVVSRDRYSEYGIRAHSDMTFGKCCYSLILPWHNEWVNIWLYLAFALYFWIQLCFILAKYKLYKLNNDIDWLLMFITTLGIAVSVTASAVYLTFYSISVRLRDILEAVNLQGIILMTYCLIFVVIATEWAPRQPLGFYFLFLSVLLLMGSLVLIQYPNLRLAVVIAAVSFVLLVLLMDLLFFANARQLRIFYLPLLVELLIVGLGVLALFFRVPERWFRRTKWLNLYLNSSIIYTVFLINFLFELHNILYYTIKANSNTLDDDDEWWHTKNIYNEN